MPASGCVGGAGGGWGRAGLLQIRGEASRTLAQYLGGSCGFSCGRATPVCEDGESSWSYAELASRVFHLRQKLLELGVSRGQRVGVMMPNSAQHLAGRSPGRAGRSSFRFEFGGNCGFSMRLGLCQRGLRLVRAAAGSQQTFSAGSLDFRVFEHSGVPLRTGSPFRDSTPFVPRWRTLPSPAPSSGRWC